MKKNLHWLLSISMVLSVMAANGKVTLPYFFSNNMILQQQTSAAVWGWSKPGIHISITTSWNKTKYSTIADATGKWETRVATPSAGGPYSMTISDGDPITIQNILIGEVWLCSGQSNMEMPMKGFRDQPILGSNDAILNAENDQIRLYTIPRSVQRVPLDTSKQSAWKICHPETVGNFSATAYYFGKMLQEKLKVPIALINISYGGSPIEAFMDAETLKSFPEISIPMAKDTNKLSNKNATVLYNGMLHPFLGFTIRGAIWYQGESNNEKAAQYEKLFPAFVQQIRKQARQGDFPFYYCQIAPYNYNNAGMVNTTAANSANLRDAQRKALKMIPNSGMAVLMDLGEEFNIHPPDKATSSKRLAYLALANTYGLKGIAAESPAYESMSINGNSITLKFSNTPYGLTSYGKKLVQFKIAGPNKVFRVANATISGGNVIVSSPEVTNPVSVRYGYEDFIIGMLYNTEGLPVSSFRTDDW